MPGALAALLLAGLLGWAGWVKLTGPAENAALTELLHDAGRTRSALRGLGTVELVLAAALVTGTHRAGWAAAALGAGFVGYLAWARAVAPAAGCGCTSSRSEPVTARSFARAGLVVAGGLAATTADRPWWTVLADRQGPAVTILAVGVAVVGMLTADPVWLLPLRRARLRLLGHPHAAVPADIPVAASVELLETSLAWHSAAEVVRSGLLESWDDAGWRFLRFAGVAAGRAVTVVFAVDAAATVDTTDAPVVRVSVVDDEREEVVPTPWRVRALLPLAD